MKAIGMPSQGRPLVTCEQQHMPTPSANPQYLAEQRTPLDSAQMIMSENNARFCRKPLNGGQQIITKTRIGHKPDFRQGVASRHALAYSDAL